MCSSSSSSMLSSSQLSSLSWSSFALALTLALTLLLLADALSDTFALLLQALLLHPPQPSHPMSFPILAHACQLKPSSLVCAGGCRKRLRSMKVKSSKSSKSSQNFKDFTLVKIHLFLHAEVQALFDGQLTPNITFIHTCRELTDAIKSGHERSLTGRSVWKNGIGCSLARLEACCGASHVVYS